MKFFKENFINYIMVSLCSLLVIGYMLSILLNYNHYEFEIVIAPTVIASVINGICLAFYLSSRIKYFRIIRMHVDNKYFNFCYISIGCAFFVNILALLLTLIFKFPPVSLALQISMLIIICVFNLAIVGFHLYATSWINRERMKKLSEEEGKKTLEDESKNKKEEANHSSDELSSKNDASSSECKEIKNNSSQEASAGKFYEE